VRVCSNVGFVSTLIPHFCTQCYGPENYINIGFENSVRICLCMQVLLIPKALDWPVTSIDRMADRYLQFKFISFPKQISTITLNSLWIGFIRTYTTWMILFLYRIGISIHAYWNLLPTTISQNPTQFTLIWSPRRMQICTFKSFACSLSGSISYARKPLIPTSTASLTSRDAMLIMHNGASFAETPRALHMLQMRFSLCNYCHC
jgi:hypothetical protein